MAIGSATFTDISAGVGDLFAASSDQAKAQGDFLEAQNFNAAASLAEQNSAFTATSTAVKQAQLSRGITQTLGGQEADVAAGGLAESGTALNVLSSSASQGALTQAVAGQQGLITEAGFQEQATADENEAEAATIAGNSENSSSLGSDIMAGIQGVAAVASIFVTGGASAPETIGLDGLAAIH
jgi:hypothetical protein